MEKVTYVDACNFIAEEWNKDAQVKLTGKQIFDKFTKDFRFSPLYISYIYDIAKEGHLTGMLLSKPLYAKAFLEMTEEV